MIILVVLQLLRVVSPAFSGGMA